MKLKLTSSLQPYPIDLIHIESYRGDSIGLYDSYNYQLMLNDYAYVNRNLKRICDMFHVNITEWVHKPLLLFHANRYDNYELVLEPTVKREGYQYWMIKGLYYKENSYVLVSHPDMFDYNCLINAIAYKTLVGILKKYHLVSTGQTLWASGYELAIDCYQESYTEHPTVMLLEDLRGTVDYPEALESDISDSILPAWAINYPSRVIYLSRDTLDSYFEFSSESVDNTMFFLKGD